MTTTLDTLEQKVAALLKALEEQGVKQEYGNVLREILRELQQYHAKIGSLRINLDQVGELVHREVESNYSKIESLRTDIQDLKVEVYGSLESKIKSLGSELDIFKEEIDFLKRTPVDSLSDFKEQFRKDASQWVNPQSHRGFYATLDGVLDLYKGEPLKAVMFLLRRAEDTYPNRECQGNLEDLYALVDSLNNPIVAEIVNSHSLELAEQVFQSAYQSHNRSSVQTTAEALSKQKSSEQHRKFTKAATPILPSLPSAELPSASIIATPSVVRTSYFHQTANRVSSFFKRHGLLLLAGTVLTAAGGYGVYQVVQRQRMNSYFNAGVTELQANNYEAAISDFNQVILLDSNNTDAYYNRGIAHYYKKEYDTALTDYNQAIALNQNDFRVYHNRGLAHYYNKEYDAALADYTKAIALQPNSDNAYHNRALVWQAKGETEKAAKDFGMEAVIKQRVGLTTP